jgi:hypothetical protein
VFAGKQFLWIRDLAAADALVQIPALPLIGSSLNLLPIILACSVLVYAVSLRRRRSLWGHGAWLLVAIGLGLVTYPWSAAVLLFVVTLFWVGIVELWVLCRPTASDEPATAEVT